jgi:hypothetical protein
MLLSALLDKDFMIASEDNSVDCHMAGYRTYGIVGRLNDFQCSKERM